MLVLGEHACGIGMLALHVEPPLDGAALMSLGHAAMMQKQQSHLGVRGALDSVRGGRDSEAGECGIQEGEEVTGAQHSTQDLMPGP